MLYGSTDIRTVNLSFRVGRRIESSMMDEGDTIKVGQVLDEPDYKSHKVALMQAEVSVSVAQAQYDLMLAGYCDEEIARATVAVRRAQAAYDYAQNFHNRQQGLWKSRIISANDLGGVRFSYDQAQAALKSARNKLRQYRSGNREQDVTQMKVSLEQAQAQLTQVELNLQDSTLVAPSNGALLMRAVEPDTAPNEGDTVFTVPLTRPTQVRAYVDERDLDQTQLRRRVLLYTDDCPNKPHHGQIGFVSPTAEFTPKTVETLDLHTGLIYRLRAMVIDVDDTLRQGIPVTVQFDDEVGHE